MRSRAVLVLLATVVAMLMLTGVAGATGKGYKPKHHHHGERYKHGQRHATISGEVGKGVTRRHRHHHWLHRRWTGHTTESDALRYVGSRGRRSPGDYLRANPAISTSPDRTPTTLSGWLYLRRGVPDTVATVGLVDRASLKAGQSGRQEGAFIYVHTFSNGGVRIGLTDGNIGGELVQESKIYQPGDVPWKVWVEFTVDGTDDSAALTECANDDVDVPTADGCMTLVIDDENPIVDSYGTITAPGFDDEFECGAVPGWEAWPGGRTGIKYDLRVRSSHRR